MMTLIRPLCVAMLAAVALGCGGGGSEILAPRELAGTWLSAWREPAFITGGPDTLVLDGHGGGRMARRLFIDATLPGETARMEWATGDVQYRVVGRSVYLRACLHAPTIEFICDPGSWPLVGRFGEDGMLWVGPTSLTSSMSALPWRRAD